MARPHRLVLGNAIPCSYVAIASRAARRGASHDFTNNCAIFSHNSPFAG